jgi:hypothetical protein
MASTSGQIGEQIEGEKRGSSDIPAWRTRKASGRLMSQDKKNRNSLPPPTIFRRRTTDMLWERNSRKGRRDQEGAERFRLLGMDGMGPEEEKDAGEKRGEAAADRRAGRLQRGATSEGITVPLILFFSLFLSTRAGGGRGDELRRSVPTRRRRLRDSSCERVRVDVDQAAVVSTGSTRTHSAPVQVQKPTRITCPGPPILEPSSFNPKKHGPLVTG